MIDTHSHVLPGIDDGAKTLEESIELCRMAADDGLATMVCTPHISFRYANNRASIEAAFDRLAGAIAEEGIALTLVKGAEVHMSPDILDKVRSRDLVTYNDGARYLLLEFPFQQVLNGAEEMVYRLKLAGITAVIAHPERIGYFMDDPDRLFQLIRLGALGQVTGGSLLGQFGEKSKDVGLEMIERQLVHVVASDAHDASYRRPVLAEAARTVAMRFDAERVRSMFHDLPAAIVSGAEIDPPPPVESQKRFKSFLSRFFAGKS